jgi:type VI secretion system secreted protein Hcp
MAVDFFLKLDGIDGESVDTNHKNEIQILSFSWGGSQTTSVAGTGGSGAGKVSLAELSIMKTYDKASPKLFKSLCSGTHIKTGTLTASKAGGAGKPFIQIDLQELFVTSLQISGSSEVPMESVSLSYNEIKIEYFVQNEQGNLASTGAITYNLKENKLT